MSFGSIKSDQRTGLGKREIEGQSQGQVASTSDWMSYYIQQVPIPNLINRNTQLEQTIPWHSSTRNSVPPDTFSINIASDEELTNDHGLEFGLGSDLIQVHNNFSQGHKALLFELMPFCLDVHSKHLTTNTRHESQSQNYLSKRKRILILLLSTNTLRSLK